LKIEPLKNNYTGQMSPCDRDIEDDNARTIAYLKMTQIDSRVVQYTMNTIVNLLTEMGINKLMSVSFGGSGETSFHFMAKLCVIKVEHQSHSGATLEFFTDGVSHARPILWSPLWDKWVIIYLISGYFRIPAGVILLHMKTTTFCEYVKKSGRWVCKVCGLEKKLLGRHDGNIEIPKNQFRLVMLHPEGSEESREQADRLKKFGLDNFRPTKSKRRLWKP
jgi:hypothetical protein